MHMKRRIGLLGGTFNPPHTGHFRVADGIYHEFSLDGIVFIPVGEPPHKRTIGVASDADRLAMLRIMTRNVPYMSVSEIETSRCGYTYTVDTLSLLDTIYGRAAEFFYIIGTDTLFELKNWKDSARVVKMCTYICVPRPGDDTGSVLKEIERLRGEYGANILLSRTTGPDISSTEIRSSLAAGKVPEGLEPPVLEYIIENKVFE